MFLVFTERMNVHPMKQEQQPLLHLSIRKGHKPNQETEFCTRRKQVVYNSLRRRKSYTNMAQEGTHVPEEMKSWPTLSKPVTTIHF